MGHHHTLILTVAPALLDAIILRDLVRDPAPKDVDDRPPREAPCTEPSSLNPSSIGSSLKARDIPARTDSPRTLMELVMV